jgi:hypothetical protein
VNLAARLIIDPYPRCIAGLRESLVFRLAVQLYQRHGPREGACPRCGRAAPCPSRCHAAAVIEAAGEDPGRYDVAARLDAGEPSIDDDLPPVWYGARLPGGT